MSTNNHFSQISVVLNKINGDKDFLEKFSRLKTVEDQYSFTLDLCKQFSIGSDYTLEQFYKFYFLVAVLQDPEVVKLLDSENLEEFKSKIINYKNSNISEDDINEFFQLGNSSKQEIHPEALDNISGGGLSPLTFNQAFSLYNIGSIFGATLKSSWKDDDPKQTPAK